MNNKEKNIKYSNLMEKLKNAIENEYYYEAIFLEYAIIEDRTRSLLKHADITLNDENNREKTLNKKLYDITHNVIFKDEYIKKHLTKDLIDSCYKWKDNRNELIHDLIYAKYEDEEIKKIALDGYDLVKTLNNKSTLVTKYLDANKQ